MGRFTTVQYLLGNATKRKRRLRTTVVPCWDAGAGGGGAALAKGPEGLALANSGRTTWLLRGTFTRARPAAKVQWGFELLKL